MKHILGSILSCLFLFSCVSVYAEPKQGYDVLGLAMYCGEYLKAPKMEAVSTLLNTFGDPLPCIEKRIAQGGLSLVQVDLIDATCWRNNKCPPGVPRPDDLGAITKRAQKVSTYATKFPEIEWWLSAALEHDVKDNNKVKAMMKAAQKGCPTCKIINSPFSGARLNPLELHGTKVRAFAVSGDGASCFDGDNIRSDGNGFEHRVSGSDVTFGWWNELNLRCTGEKVFTPPLKRTEKPTQSQFRQWFLTARPEQSKPSAPSQCKKVAQISGKEIYKPNAESYCNGVPKDKRSNKPLLIIKKQGHRGDKIKALNSAGKVVGCFQYYGVYQGDLHRWYMGDCSGQDSTQLFNDFGGEWGFVATGGGNCLLINSVRRLGLYR